MEWTQFIIFIGSFVGLFFWNRSESRADMRHMDAKVEEHRKETNITIRHMETLISAIHEEMKDFHGRLEKQDMEFRMRFLAIEERRGK